jgi:hypothetical protein
VIFVALIVMQLVLQFGPGSTVTVKELTAPLPHVSEAVTLTVVVVPSGKQVPGGGLNVSVAPPGQQVSMAEAV